MHIMQYVLSMYLGNVLVIYLYLFHLTSKCLIFKFKFFLQYNFDDSSMDSAVNWYCIFSLFTVNDTSCLFITSYKKYITLKQKS